MEDSKLHEETLKIAKSLIERDPALKDWVTEKFSELKESEDEKIRKEIIAYLSSKVATSEETDLVFIKKWISWLEKQGEQKPAWSEEDKLVIHNIVLWLDGQYISEKARKQCLEWFNKHRIEFLTQPQQKPAWSEEDESHIGRILSYLESFKAYNTPHIEPIKKEIDWLKSLKDRIQPQPKQEWSDIDEQMLEAVLYDGENALGERHKEWIKNLKYRVQPQPKQEWSEEDKGNLLDLKCVIDEVWHNQDVREEIDHSGEELESLWHWLDNIWQRVEYHQNHWKPSEEQIGALCYAYCELFKRGENGEGANCVHPLSTLIDELKKL